MADDAIVFATANPIPEIWPWEALEAGAKVVATGRSDFPNQVNNSLGFPGIFRGTLDVKAKTISDTMCLAAVMAIAKTAENNGLSETYIVPTMDEWEVFPTEAAAVGMAAISEGLARVKKSRKELYEGAEAIIKRARDQTKYLMKGKFILPAAEGVNHLGHAMVETLSKTPFLSFLTGLTGARVLRATRLGDMAPSPGSSEFQHPSYEPGAT